MWVWRFGGLDCIIFFVFFFDFLLFFVVFYYELSFGEDYGYGLMIGFICFWFVLDCDCISSSSRSNVENNSFVDDMCVELFLVIFLDFVDEVM